MNRPNTLCFHERKTVARARREVGRVTCPHFAYKHPQALDPHMSLSYNAHPFSDAATLIYTARTSTCACNILHFLLLVIIEVAESKLRSSDTLPPYGSVGSPTSRLTLVYSSSPASELPSCGC